jgi:hypothetical protein
VATVWPLLAQGASTTTLSWTADLQRNSGSENAIGPSLSAAEEASAQVIPTERHFSFSSALNPGATSEVFALLTSDPSLGAVAVDVAPQSATDPAIEMAMYDVAGHQISDAVPGPQPRSVALDFAIDPANSSPEVYVKIAAPPGAFDSASPSSTAPSESFVLQVTRGPESSQPSSLPFLQGLTPSPRLGSGPSATATVVSQSGLNAGTPPMMGSAGDVQAELVVGGALVPVVGLTPDDGQSMPPSSSPVATGPLPERAGAPLGGVLAEGDPVPQLDRRDPALVDLALIGLPEPEAGAIAGVGAADLEAIVAELERAPEKTEGSVAFRGPGGLPVLTASLPREPKVDAETLVAALPPAYASSNSTRIVPAPAVIAAVTDRARDRETLAQPRQIARASVLPGLTAALATVFSVILPDMSRLLAAPAARRFRLRFPFRLRRSL